MQKRINRLNIVHTIAAYPPHAGGMEHNTRYNATEIAKRGHNVSVYTSDMGFKPVQTREGRLTVNYLNSINIAHTPIIPTLFIKLITLPRGSIMHIHIAQAFIPEVSFLVCKLKKIPYLCHVHLDVGATGPMGFLLPIYKKIILGPILRRADAVTVLTPDYVKLVSEKYGVDNKKIKLIPNGTYFSPGKKKKNGVHKPLRIFFAGRLSKQKNIPLLLNSVEIVLRKYNIPFILIIAGDGEEKKKTLALIKKLKLSKHVKLYGTLPPPDIQKWQRWADISLVTSKSEAFGTVVTEAMASGTPVVATNIFSVRNLIKNGYSGILTESKPDKFAEAIKKLVDEPAYYKKIATNGLSASKEYKWPAVIDKYEKLYFKLSRMIKQ